MGSCFLSCLPIDDAPVQLAISDVDEGLRALGRGRSAGAGRALQNVVTASRIRWDWEMADEPRLSRFDLWGK